MKTKKAIYAFSGDPITLGHIDIIERAARVFDEVIVAIGINPAKKYLFTQEERQEMAQAALTHLMNVTVTSFQGLLVDFAFENNIPVIIKGLRNIEDFGFEMVLHQVGESQKLEIDTFFIPSRQELQHISSGAVKAIQLEHGNINEYVPMIVKQKLEERLSGQFFVGLVDPKNKANIFIENLKNQMPVHTIDVQALHEELSKVTEERVQIQVLELKIRRIANASKGLILLKADQSTIDCVARLCNNRLIFMDDDLNLTEMLRKKINLQKCGDIFFVIETQSETGLREIFQYILSAGSITHRT